MPEKIDDMEEIREFEVALKHQNKSDEQIEEDYYKVFKKVDDYGKISIIKMLIHHRPDLACNIFRKTTKSHTEKIVE